MTGLLFIGLGLAYTALGIDQIINGKRRKREQEFRDETAARRVAAMEDANDLKRKEMGNVHPIRKEAVNDEEGE